MSYKSVLTEGELRGKCMPLNTQEYCVKPNVYVTQGVKDYLKEKKIVLKYEDTAQGTSVDTTFQNGTFQNGTFQNGTFQKRATI